MSYANSLDPDQTPILRRLIWVCTVCLCSNYGTQEAPPTEAYEIDGLPDALVAELLVAVGGAGCHLTQVG